MTLKRYILILLLTVLAINMFAPIFANATLNTEVNDGKIESSNGVVSLYGPKNITNSTQAKGHVIVKYKAIITFVGGIATVTMVAIFIIQFLKLGVVTTNPRDRKEVLTGLLISGISAALLGSITFYVGVFYGLFRYKRTNIWYSAFFRPRRAGYPYRGLFEGMSVALSMVP